MSNNRTIDMQLTKESKFICGALLLAILTIMYGGYTSLGILLQGEIGHKPSRLVLEQIQLAIWRTGHARAGVLVILSLRGTGIAGAKLYL